MSSFALTPTNTVAPSLGIGTRVINGSFGGLQTAANILDTPAAVLRNTLYSIANRGEDIEKIFTGIYDVDDRISGTELIGGEPGDFTLGGLATEIILDPLNFVTIGAKTAVGELASRAGKLADRTIAEGAFADKGFESSAKRLDQTVSARESVQRKLKEAGRDPYERLKDSIKEQFAAGQRSLLQLDIPFTSIRKELSNSALGGRLLGSASDNIKQIVTENPVAGEIREKFITTRKNPIEEALRKEGLNIVREGQQRTRIIGKELFKKRLLLQAKDPNVDLKVIRILQESGEALDLPDEALTGFARIGQVEKMIKARLNVEELYGEIDNFDEVWAFAQQMRRLNKELLSVEQATGVPVTEFTEFGYVARVLTSEGAALLKESKKGRDTIIRHFNKLDAGSPGAFQHARTFDQLGIEELNKQLATIYKKDPKSFKFFDTDVVSIQVNRMLESARQVGRSAFSQAVIDVFGVDKSIKGLKTEGLVGIEKLIKPRGPLVTTTRLHTDLSGRRLAEYLANKVPVEGAGEGIEIAGYKFDDVTEKVIDNAVHFRLQDNFRGVSENHALLDVQWDELIKEGRLTKQQRLYLRTFFAQVKPENLENIAVRGISDTDIKVLENLFGGSFSDVTGLYLASRGGDFTSGLGPIPTIGIRGTNLTKMGENFNPYNTMLHEFGHAYHLSYLTDAQRADIQGVLDRFAVHSGTYEGEVVIKKITGRDSILNYNQEEIFANAFAAWAQGARTSDATLEKIFKKVSDDFKNYRDTIYTDSKLVGDEKQLTDLFGQSLQSNAEIINKLPSSARKIFLGDLLDPVHTRRGIVEFAVDASEKDIRDALKAAGVKRTALPKEAMDFAESFLKHSSYHLDSDKWWAKTIRFLDELHSIYRTAFTQYFPAFYSRNMISNVFMNMMAGDVGIKHYVRALNQLRAMTPEDALYLGGLGVLDSGKIREVFEFMQESRGGISRSMKSFIARAPGGEALAKAGRKVDTATREGGHAIENFTRYAHFLAKKDAGFTDSEAAESVIKFLFDYQDLTDFERAVPRRMMLFYTFFRKNLPLMLEQTFKNPRFMMLYARSTGQTNSSIVEPDWLPDSFFFGSDEQGRTIRLNFGLPPEDLARFDPEGKGLSRVFELMISSLVPVIREPFQFVSGKDLFTGRPREGGLLEIGASNLPTSRATGTVQRILDAAAGDDPNLQLAPELVRTLTGIASRPIDERVQKKLEQVDAIRDRLDELVRTGKGRKFEVIGQRRGREPNPEIRELNSMQARILREIARQGSQ